MTSRKTTRPPVSLHPLAPAYRLSAARHSARASANANAATRAAASAISGRNRPVSADAGIVVVQAIGMRYTRSEEHTSELQSHSDLVCRLLLEKKKQHK